MKSSLTRDIALGLDLGGTLLKCGVVTRSGKLLRTRTQPSLSSESSAVILKNLLHLIEEETLWARQKGYRVLGVGLGVPGILSMQKGIVHRSPHFPSWIDYPIRTHLEKKLKLPFALENDAKIATLGEGWLGAGRSRKNYLMLTLGTGVGGGMMLDGKIWKGDSGFAGEVGHVVIEKAGRPCNCGGKGCLEMYASGTAIAYDIRDLIQRRRIPSAWRKIRKDVENLTPRDLSDLAQAKDVTALKIFESFGKALGAGLASLVNILDTEWIILGGGLLGAWDFFISSTHSSIKNHLYPTTAKKLKIKKALLGNKAGMIGAARALMLKFS